MVVVHMNLVQDLDFHSYIPYVVVVHQMLVVDIDQVELGYLVVDHTFAVVVTVDLEVVDNHQVQDLEVDAVMHLDMLLLDLVVVRQLMM